MNIDRERITLREDLRQHLMFLVSMSIICNMCVPAVVVRKVCPRIMVRILYFIENCHEYEKKNRKVTKTYTAVHISGVTSYHAYVACIFLTDYHLPMSPLPMLLSDDILIMVVEIDFVQSNVPIQHMQSK